MIYFRVIEILQQLRQIDRPFIERGKVRKKSAAHIFIFVFYL